MVDREAGANSLRGGRNTYSSKCRIGNFVEEEFRPEVQRKGFTKVRGSSSARAALYFEWMLRSAWKVGGSSYIAKNDKSFGAHNDHHAH